MGNRVSFGGGSGNRRQTDARRSVRPARTSSRSRYRDLSELLRARERRRSTAVRRGPWLARHDRGHHAEQSIWRAAFVPAPVGGLQGPCLDEHVMPPGYEVTMGGPGKTGSSAPVSRYPSRHHWPDDCPVASAGMAVSCRARRADRCAGCCTAFRPATRHRASGSRAARLPG